MKIRTGFVSNSSSSSFVFAFDKAPATAGEVVDLFGEGCGEAAMAVWSLMKGKTLLQASDVREELERHWGGDEDLLAPFLEKHKEKVFFVFECGDHHGDYAGDFGYEMESAQSEKVLELTLQDMMRKVIPDVVRVLKE